LDAIPRLAVSLVSFVLAQCGPLHQSRLVDSFAPLDQPHAEASQLLTQR